MIRINSQNDIDIFTKLGTLVLINKERFSLNFNKGFLLADSLKSVYNILLEIYSEEINSEIIEHPFIFEKLTVLYCPACTGGVDISLKSIFTALEISSKIDENTKIVLSFDSKHKRQVKVNLNCEHSGQVLIEISNKIVTLFKDDKVFFNYRINDFGEFGKPKIKPNAVSVADYEKVLTELTRNVEVRGLLSAWHEKKNWILRNKPERIFQDFVYGFLNGYFFDGEIHEQVHLSGGYLDIALEGFSLFTKGVLIEIKWIGKSISNSRNKNEIKYTIFSTNEVFGGIEQLNIYQNGYKVQRKKEGIPILLVFDAEKEREAFNIIGNLSNNTEIKWARLLATSPSKQ